MIAEIEAKVHETPLLFKGPMVRAMLAGHKTVTRRPCDPDVPEDASECFLWPWLQPMSHHKNPGLWARRHPTIDTIEECSNDGWLRFLGKNPYGWPGERIWVRETWAPAVKAGMRQVAYAADGRWYSIGADFSVHQGYVTGVTDKAIPNWSELHGNWVGRGYFSKWRPSIHMPRWACRLLLEIVSIRPERLQDIDELDALAEGVEGHTAEGVMKESGKPERRAEFVVGEAREQYRELWDETYPFRPWDSNPWVWRIEFKKI